LAFENINIFGLRIDKANYNELLAFVEDSIIADSHSCIAYANANLLNLVYKDNKLRECINTFSVIHPDGVGVYLASKRLYGNNGIKARFTGSDFYPLLAAKAIEKKRSVFFFGHSAETLEKIRTNIPGLNIAGMNEGYDFDEREIIEKINRSKPQLLIIGLPSPQQELWLYKNRDKISFGCAILTGEGIKVFAGTKIRGPKIIRALGFEWFVRLIFNPAVYWKRYLIGIPLFLYRIVNKKLAILHKNR